MLEPTPPNSKPNTRPQIEQLKLWQRAALGLFAVLGHLPLGFARSLGSAIAGLRRLGLFRNARSVKVTRRNIERCFPELASDVKAQLIAQSLAHTARLAMELPIVWRRDASWFSKRTRFACGEELLSLTPSEASQQQSSSGLLVLAPHIGNWEVVGLTLAQKFSDDYACLYQEPKHTWLNTLMQASRGRFGGVSLPTSRKGLVQLSKHVKNGKLTGILPDQVPDSGGGIIAPFFNQPCLTMTLAHSIIQRTQCRVVMMAALRTERGFDLHCLPADAGVYSDDKEVSVAALNRSVEAIVELAPAQYQWEYKRFRRNGEQPGFYHAL